MQGGCNNKQGCAESKRGIGPLKTSWVVGLRLKEPVWDWFGSREIRTGSGDIYKGV